MKYRNKVAWIAIVFLANALIVHYLIKDQVFYSEWFGESTAISGEKPGQNNPIEISQPEIGVKPLQPALNSTKQAVNVPNHTATIATCKTKQPKSTSIYRWVDESGVIHLSNKTPPPLKGATLVKQIKPESISIDLIGDLPPDGFRSALRKRIDSAISYFERVTDETLVTPVRIKIRLFNNKAKYSEYRNRVAPNLAYAPAFYSAGTNESAVYMGSPHSGLNSATHEAMHAINRAWYGNMRSWLNEGMAEVAESSERGGEWLTTLRKGKPISLRELVTAKANKWNGDGAREYYAMSWAFTSYLMDKYPAKLAAILLFEGSNGCDTADKQHIEEAVDKNIEVIQQDFNLWLTRKYTNNQS